MQRKWIKVFYGLGAFIAALFILFVSVVFTPVNWQPYQESAYYKATLSALHPLPPTDTSAIEAGWGKVSITPEKPVPMAGYADRKGKLSEGVADSVWVRAIVLRNNSQHVALVSMDMLIVPPSVLERLTQQLPAIGYSLPQVYFSATHSHNSVGGWAKNYIGELFAGSYDPLLVDWLAGAVIQAIRRAEQVMEPVSISYAEVEAPHLVYNRLIGEAGTEDAQLRVIHLERRSGIKAVWWSFAAHATCLPASVMRLSGDYPGRVAAQLASQADFVMYMAGAVGSQGPEIALPQLKDFDRVAYMADSIAVLIKQSAESAKPLSARGIHFARYPLYLREPHVRVARQWRLRPWLFYRFYGDYPAHVSSLQIGDLLFLGMPCDFSGELTAPLLAKARQQGFYLLPTSFNGAYIGYITPDDYYDNKTYETRVMNWFGPFNAAYLSEIGERIIELHTSAGVQ